MANTKISALTAATTPVAGTETLPIVQGGVTKQVSIANLTAGRAVSAASLTLTTPLPVSSGGTGLSSFTANTIPYATATTTLTSGTALQFSGRVIGIRQTPSAWASNYTGLQGQESYGAFLSDNGNGAFESVSNAYNDGTWKYKNSSVGAVRVMGDAVAKSFKFYTAPAGTADTAVTWTQRFTVSDTAVTFNADNLVQGTAAKGINFTANTPAAGMTSQLLNWYEEGTWTPNTTWATFVGAASSSGTYTRIGRQVTVNGTLTGATSVTVGASGILTSDLPFTASYDAVGSMVASTNTASGVVRVTGPYVVAATTMSPVTSITFTATYFV